MYSESKSNCSLKVGEAYATLSDEKKRRRSDKKNKKNKD